jgi:DivIVA domain-containing protein
MGFAADRRLGGKGDPVALTPDEVESKEFVRVMRGYDPAEVASFLRTVAAELRRRDQLVDAIQGATSGPLADEVVAVLESAYHAARTRKPAAHKPAARKPAARRSTPARAAERRARPLRLPS